MQNSRKRTGYCQKVRFKNSVAAKEAIKRFNAEKRLNGDKWLLKSYYRCSECQAWHLTSMSKKLSSKIKEKQQQREQLLNPEINTINNRLKYLLKKNRLSGK